jgi:hypothetical protein
MDIKNPKVLYLKGALFVVAGLMAAAAIILENPSFKTTALLALCVWCFSRAYYFAFYVVEHYVDREYRFAGLWSFFKYATGRPRGLTTGRAPKSGA